MPDTVRPYHLEQLAALCREYPIERKVVFVPSPQVGQNIGSALARTGINWVNLYLTSPEEWARQIAEPALRAEGWRPLAHDIDLFFVHERISRIEWPPKHPFAAGFSTEGISRVFLKTLRVLRSAEVSPARVASALLRLGDPLNALYSDYCAWLEERRLYDQAHLFAVASDMVREDGVVAVFDETNLSPAAERFLKALSGGEIRRIGRREYGLSVPQDSAAMRFRSIPAVPLGTIAAGGHLALRGLTPADSERVELREAIGAENEVRGVLRRLLADGSPLDSVEIAYTSEDPYLPLILDTADRLGLPIKAASGVPVTFTAPGQAVLHFFRWIASGFDPAELIGLCRSRLLSTGRLSSADLGQILEEARVRRGVYAEALQRLIAKVKREAGEAASPEQAEYLARRIQTIESAASVIDRLFGMAPRSGWTSLKALCESGVLFVEELAHVRTDRESRTRDSIRDRLRELAASSEIEGPTNEIASILASLVSEHKVEASIARPGHLYVVPLSRAGYSGRDRLVIVGMAETTFPGVASEDPILLDYEREELSKELALERGRASESVWHLVRALGMASGKVTLTSCRRSIADGRETYPSAVFQQIAEQLGIKHPPIDNPVPGADLALDEAEVVLSLRSDGLLEEVYEERPWLSFGRSAEVERRSPALGRYHGWLGEPTPELRPTNQPVISVSRLEDLAACPYRYFLKHVLGVKPPEVAQEMPGRWLTPLEFGSLLHAVLREFMQELTDRRERIDATAHRPRLIEILHRCIDEMREVVPVEYEAGYRADVGRLERAASIFLNEEARRSVEPFGFEVSFGMGSSDGLNVAEPVPVKLSDTMQLMLRGSIDRVDRSGDGFEVWDYKTGSTFDFDERDLISGGRRLQWALYAFVLEHLLETKGIEGKARESGYFFTSDRENGLRLSQSPPDREDVAQRIEPLFDLVEEGAFLHVQKVSVCKFCDFNGICSSEGRLDKELDDLAAATPADRPFLEPLMRWMS